MLEEFARLRHLMVQQQLIPRGISSPSVLAAMNSVPRHEFVPFDLRSRAYDDTPLPIGYEQTISQPFMVAFMIQSAKLSSSDVALEVGGGCGYAAAVMSLIARQVYSCDIVQPLAEQAKERVANLGYKNLQMEYGDGLKLFRGRGPFDAILVAACSPDIPKELKENLKINGRLIIPVGKNDFSSPQVLVRVIRTGEDNYIEEPLEYVMFVPLKRTNET